MPEQQRRILIIDDEAPVLSALERFFKMKGDTVELASTGRGGIQAFERFSPDVTILDLHLPDLGGLEVLERLSRRKAMVLMLTGYGDVEKAVEAMKLGAENFLTKPVELSHLGAAVDKAAEKASLAKENVKLRRRLTPNSRRRVLKAAAFIGFLAVSAYVGSLIGMRGTPGTSVRAQPPIPIPADTTTTTSGSPLIPTNRQ